MEQLTLKENDPDETENEYKKQQLKIIVDSLETPFAWLPEQPNSRTDFCRSYFSAVDSDFMIRKHTPEDDEKGFIKYIKYMRVVYEMEISNKNNVVATKLEEWKQFFFDTIERAEDEFFNKNELALKHVLYSTEAYLLLKKKDYQEVETKVNEIKKIDLQAKTSRATINGLKANFFDAYGIKGHEMALIFAEEAMKLLQDEPNWIYITAKTMRDIRRSVLYNTENVKESLEKERDLFRKLVKFSTLHDKPMYLIRYGTSLHDYATHLHVKHTKERRKHNYDGCYDCNKVKKYCDEGVQCFKDALDIGNSPKRKTYLRIIVGVNNIPRFISHKYKDFTKMCVQNILSTQFNNDKDGSEVYYAVGKYYQHLEKNLKEAENYFIKAANLGSLNAMKDLIIVKFQNSGGTYDPCKDIINRMNEYPDKPKKLESICQMASFHLYIKRDWSEVVSNLKNLIEEDQNLSTLYLRKHKPWFLDGNSYSGLRDLLKDIIKEMLGCLRNQNVKTEEREMLLEFITSVKNIVPDLL